jgi:Ca-activated chloride channel family protein
VAQWAAVAAALTVGLLVMAPRAEAIGLLIPQDPQLPPLAIKSHQVKIDVTDQASVTRVQQVFVNHTSRQLEATFYFPVPPGATVSDFSLWINGKKTKGAVMEKGKARQIYEDIVRRTQDPGLIEYMDGTLFQARIFPVPARGEQKLEIAFAQVLDQQGSVRRLLYPLKTGRGAARVMEDFSVEAHISSRQPLKAIYSPSHKVHVRREGDHEATVSIEEANADLEKDLLLYMATGGEDIGLTLLSYDKDGQGGQEGYFLMVLAPRFDIKEDELPHKAVTFVVDTSGSMAGQKMEQAREALQQSLGRLRPGDRFNVVRFSTDVEPLFDSPQLANAQNVRRGLDFAADLEAAGGTAIDEALTEALRPKVADMPHMVIFMTDGRPTVGSTDIKEIVAHVQQNNRHQARVFTFGVGFKVNTTLLDQVAREHGGSADYVRPQEDIELKVSALYNKIAYPVMTDIRLDWGQARVFDVYPRKAPDLFRGGQVVIMGRARGELPEEIKVTGVLAGKPVGMAFEAEPEEDSQAGSRAHDFIPRLWATRKVGYLLEEIRQHGEASELKTEVIRLAKKYGLVTPYTSYLAVDDSELENRPPPPIVQPWRHRGVIPEGGPVLEEDRAGAGAMPRSAPARSQSVGGASAKKARRERILRDNRGLHQDTGEEAVETSIAVDAFKDAEVEDEAGGLRTRYLDGVLFVYQGGAWRQEGAQGQAQVKIKAFSRAYFNLLAAHPGLKAPLALGQRVIVKVGGKVVEVGPEGRGEVPVEEIKKW